MGVIKELAQVLQFRVTNVEAENKKAEIDRRIERYESGQAKLIRPDWQKISDETNEVR